jgi:hypothetical protein
MRIFSSLSVLKTAQVLSLALCVGCALAAPAQQADSAAASADDATQQLLRRIDQLEAKVKQLEQKQVAPEPAPAALAPEPSAEVPRVNAVNDRLKLNVFGDVGYEARDLKPSTNTFEIGSLDLFMTARLSDKVSALGEVLFISQSDNSIGVDIERLLLQYRHNDYFTVGVGRFHTSIGYYNTAFHQGSCFQTAIDRPFMYAFDDEGGFLPLQEVGVTASGRIPSGKLGLSYVAEIGNGRNHLIGGEPAQNSADSNNGKSFNFAISARPSWFSGLDVGFSMYHDNLTFSDNINHSELITTAYATFLNSNYEFLNEVMMVRHVGDSEGGPGVFHTPAFYTQFSRRFASYRPYVRYQYINAGVQEPIYGDPTDGPVVGRRNGPSLGLRYDFTEHTAFKIQYDRLSVRGLPTSNGIDTQFAFTF